MVHKISIYFLFLTVTLALLFTGFSMDYALGQSSTNFIVKSDVISGGGGMSSSTNYIVEHTIGQPVADNGSYSTNFANYAGFWHTVFEVPLAMFLGDINNDGTVDISDVIRVLRIALNLDTGLPCANINNDAGIDIADVILTLRMALGLDPYRECM